MSRSGLWRSVRELPDPYRRWCETGTPPERGVFLPEPAPVGMAPALLVLLGLFGAYLLAGGLGGLTVVIGRLLSGGSGRRPVVVSLGVGVLLVLCGLACVRFAFILLRERRDRRDGRRRLGIYMDEDHLIYRTAAPLRWPRVFVLARADCLGARLIVRHARGGRYSVSLVAVTDPGRDGRMREVELGPGTQAFVDLVAAWADERPWRSLVARSPMPNEDPDRVSLS